MAKKNKKKKNKSSKSNKVLSSLKQGDTSTPLQLLLAEGDQLANLRTRKREGIRIGTEAARAITEPRSRQPGEFTAEEMQPMFNIMPSFMIPKNERAIPEVARGMRMAEAREKAFAGDTGGLAAMTPTGGFSAIGRLISSLKRGMRALELAMASGKLARLEATAADVTKVAGELKAIVEGSGTTLDISKAASMGSKAEKVTAEMMSKIAKAETTLAKAEKLASKAQTKIKALTPTRVPVETVPETAQAVGIGRGVPVQTGKEAAEAVKVSSGLTPKPAERAISFPGKPRPEMGATIQSFSEEGAQALDQLVSGEEAVKKTSLARKIAKAGAASAAGGLAFSGGYELVRGPLADVIDPYYTSNEELERRKATGEMVTELAKTRQNDLESILTAAGIAGVAAGQRGQANTFSPEALQLQIQAREDEEAIKQSRSGFNKRKLFNEVGYNMSDYDRNRLLDALSPESKNVLSILMPQTVDDYTGVQLHDDLLAIGEGRTPGITAADVMESGRG